MLHAKQMVMMYYCVSRNVTDFKQAISLSATIWFYFAAKILYFILVILNNSVTVDRYEYICWLCAS